MKIAIAGAGLLGRLLAFQLLESKISSRIALYDCDLQAGKRSAAMTAAGMLAPYAELEKSSLELTQMGLLSLQQWPSILDCLGGNIYFEKKGSLVTAHRNDYADLQHYLNKIARQAISPPYQAIQPETLESEISALNEWYYFPEEAHLDNQQLMQQLALYLKAKVQWFELQEVKHVQAHEIHLANEKHHYDYVFDCRGMGAISNFADLRALRGELIGLHAPAVNLSRPIRLIHPRYSIYIVPRPHHYYLIGASEIEAEDYSAISVRTTLELLTAVYSIHKGFIEARLVHTATNCRPTLPHHLPSIKYSDGFVAINGLYRHGFMLAPQLVSDVVQYLHSGLSQVRYSQWWEEVQ